MSLLSGISILKQFPADKQREFESYYRDNMNEKLLPVFADISLVLIITGILISAVLHATSISESALGWSSTLPTKHITWALIVSLLVVNRYTTLRQRAPLVIYLLFAVLTASSYHHFLLVKGGIESVFSLFFYTAFVGSGTASLKHTLSIIGMNILALVYSCWLVFGSLWWEEVLSILGTWFVFNCLISSMALAVFTRWIWRNYFATQFLIDDKNELLDRAYQSLKKTEGRLIQQQKLQALNHMAKGLLHEVINPINSSSQALSFADSINSDENVRRELREALAQQARVSDIVTNLRDFAHPDSHPEIERADISSLISQALKVCHVDLEQASVKVVFDDAEVMQVDCYPSALVQVFVNLILNSLDALEQKRDGDSRELAITLYESNRGNEQENTISICFRDNGIGIDPEKISKITDPFISDSNSPEKLGLGLSICQTIMRHHDGLLQIESQLNEWTEVIVSFPASKPLQSPSPSFSL